MDEDLVALMVGVGGLAVLTLFVALPWIVFHYVTKWKQSSRITPQDEHLLDEMHGLARRLEERVRTVERIVAADHPDFRASLAAPDPEWREDALARRPYRPSDRPDRRN